MKSNEVNVIKTWQKWTNRRYVLTTKQPTFVHLNTIDSINARLSPYIFWTRDTKTKEHSNRKDLFGFSLGVYRNGHILYEDSHSWMFMRFNVWFVCCCFFLFYYFRKSGIQTVNSFNADGMGNKGKKTSSNVIDTTRMKKLKKLKGYTYSWNMRMAWASERETKSRGTIL